MHCYSTNWAGVLDWGTESWHFTMAVVLRALPALGHWSTSLVWEGVREGTWAGQALPGSQPVAVGACCNI